MLPAVRHPAVPAAAVPEAAVHKHGEALLGKNEVGLAWQWTVPAPAFDSMRAQNGGQFQFGVLVAFGPNGSHDLRALSF
jgi:hypothetical protein